MFLIHALLFISHASAAPFNTYHCTTPVNASLGFTRPIRMTVETIPGGKMIGNEGHGNVTVGYVSKMDDIQKGSMTFQLMLNLFGDPSLSGLEDLSQVTHIIQYKDQPVYKETSQVLRYFAGPTQVGGTFVLRGEPIACLP